jgi:DNA-directed RNA polymerase specialized sigma24 family protein
LIELTAHTDNELLVADGIYTVVYRIVKDVEVSSDIVQDAFIAAWTRRDQVAAMEKPSLWL